MTHAQAPAIEQTRFGVFFICGEEMTIENQDADFASGYSDEPTETPAAIVKPEAATTPEPAAKLEPVDPVKELMARFDKFEAGHNKLAGHIGGLQRTQQEIQAALATAQAAAKTGSDAPTQGQVKDAMTSPAEWDALKKDYPEWATATEKLLDSRIPSFDPKAFEDAITAKLEGQNAATQQKIIHTALNAVSPGWEKTVKSDEFKAWHAAQPDDIKALAASDDIGDSATMLKLYDASKQVKAKPEPKKEISTREKRIAAAVTPRGAGGHATGSTEQDEFESGYSG